MSGKFRTAITNLFQVRDELSLRNIRVAIWPLLLLFPLSVIIGDLRFFDLNIAFIGLESYELMLYPLGLGWLVLALTPKKLIIPLLCAAATACAVLLPFQIFMPQGTGRFISFIAFQFLNGICAGAAFYIFCFVLNNIERLFGMILIQFYYGLYYTIWRAFPAVQEAGITWAAGAAILFYVIIVFAGAGYKPGAGKIRIENESDGKSSGVPFVIGLTVVYYMIMCMINYIEWMENSVDSLLFGLGSLASIALILVIHLLNNRSALYIWLLFLALSLLGLGILIFDSSAAKLSGSFAYGLGDGLGYIIIYYICAGAIKQSKSLRMFKFFCLILFVEYFIISGIFSQAFNNYHGENHFLAFSVVLTLSSVCLILIPYIQKKLFEVDWTDGQHLLDIPEYAQPLAETAEINAKDQLNLTGREHEIFTMLLTGMSPKEIGYTLKISYYTVLFHQKKLYRKLNIQSRAELFARYSTQFHGTAM